MYVFEIFANSAGTDLATIDDDATIDAGSKRGP